MAEGAGSMDDFDELLGFLSHANTDVRKIAAQSVVPYTRSVEHVTHLSTQKPAALRALCNLVGDPLVASHACSSLINLSSNATVSGQIVQCKAVDRVMTCLTSGMEVGPLMGLMLTLLSNLTATSSRAIEDMVQAEDEVMQGYYLARLIEIFASSLGEAGAPVDADTDPVQHTQWVLSILTNVASAEGGRTEVSTSPIMEKLPALLCSPRVLVRGGATALLKNLLLHVEFHDTFVETHSECCQALLGRLQAKEVGAEIRRTVVEALQALCKTESGSSLIEHQGGVAIIREATDAAVGVQGDYQSQLVELRDTIESQRVHVVYDDKDTKKVGEGEAVVAQ